MSFNDYASSGLLSSQQNNSQPLEFFENILLAVRIVDGLFIGNAISSQDDEFLFSNKVTHIVNCAALDVPNVFSEHGIHYLSFPWRDGSMILDSQNRKISRITKFMERAFDKGECVLVHSLHGISRCCVIVCAYLMYRFEWKLADALTFIKLNHPDMDIAPHFMLQLKNYAKKMPSRDSRGPPASEHILLKNTYANSLPYEHPKHAKSSSASHSKRVHFSSKLVSKRRTPSHNPSSLKSILKTKSDPSLPQKQQNNFMESQPAQKQSKPRHKARFSADQPSHQSSAEVSSRTARSSSNRQTPSSGLLASHQSSDNTPAASQHNSLDSSSGGQSSSKQEIAAPPPEPKSPNHHRLKRADSDSGASTDSPIAREKQRNGQAKQSSLRSSSRENSKPDKPVLRNNFTSSHTKVTQMPNSPKVSFPSDNQSSSSNTSSSNSTRRSRAFEIVSQASQPTDKRKRKKRSNSVDRRPLSSSYSGFSLSDANGAQDDSRLSGHRKRPTMVRKSSDQNSALFTQRSNKSSNHRIFQSRDVSGYKSGSNNHSSSGREANLSGLLTSSQLNTSGKKLSRRPRSATHRKRRPTPMQQRPQSAPNQKDRTNGTMSRMSSLENIYGTKKKRSSSKKKRKSKRSSPSTYSNVESRLYNPTLSFLRKTIQ